MSEYNFGEKKTEKSKKLNKEVPVKITAKYKQAKAKAIEIIESGMFGITEADFWILTTELPSGEYVLYSGLILSHNGCLKINDSQPAEKKFKPSCVTVDKDGFNKSLVYTYVNDEQGVYEIGEANAANCKNAYTYAMAFKRLFDRVVLKLSKLAFSGIYSDSESDDFVEPEEHKKKSGEKEPPKQEYDNPDDVPFDTTQPLKDKIAAKRAEQEANEPTPPWQSLKVTPEELQAVFGKFNDDQLARICKHYGVPDIPSMTYEQFDDYKKRAAEKAAKK